MKLSTAIAGLLVFGSLSTASFAADPGLLNLVMPDVKLLGGVDVTSAKISPFGQFLISRAQANDKGVQAMVAATGFNPFTDVTEIVGATTADSTKPGGLLLMRGAFKVDQIVAAINGGKAQSAQVQTLPGATLITFTAPDGKPSPALAFIGDSIAVAGDQPTVQATLVRASAGGSIDPALAVQVKTLSAAGQGWILGASSFASLLPAKTAQMLTSVQSFSGVASLDAGVNLSGDILAADAKSAEALGNVVKLVVSLASLNAGKDPQMAQALELLKNLSVTTTGVDVNVALAIPESQIEGFINTLPATGKAHSGN